MAVDNSRSAVSRNIFKTTCLLSFQLLTLMALLFLRSFFAIHRDAYNQVKEKVMRIGKTDAGRMIRNEPTTHCP